jgi:hypothetical protein
MKAEATIRLAYVIDPKDEEAIIRFLQGNITTSRTLG